MSAGREPSNDTPWSDGAPAPAATTTGIAACLLLTRALSRARFSEDIYSAALEALTQALGVSRSAILLFDPDGVMRFKAHRGLSESYRRAVEGHTPWSPDSPDPRPIVVADVRREPGLEAHLPAIAGEGLAAMAFIPIVSASRVIGKFMVYYTTPHAPDGEELQFAELIAAQVAFALDRTRSQDLARRSEERLLFALEAASMGTWDWDLVNQAVRWSTNLERAHDLAPGTLDATFRSYVRVIHRDDRERVLAAVQRAIEDGLPCDVEYRILARDGAIRWIDGKGRVEYANGTPVRMTGICVAVTARKEAERARLAAAEESNRLKDEFLAMLSHELRTPLNAILGWVQMLEGDAMPPERVFQAIHVIGRNAKLQAELIEDILDVSRIITGKLEIERQPLLVSQLLDTALNGVLPGARAKQLEMLREIADELPAIEGDPERLQQVLGNILSNAIKFTPERGQVALRCTADGDALTIEVRDTGVGISPDFLPFIFDRFRQADSRLTRTHGGLGLGLAIAKYLVEQHGGRISAHSDGHGRGTTFAVRLPLGTAARPVDAVTVPAPPLCDLGGISVLVVDDQLDSRELLAAVFERWGAKTLLCGSAAEALAVLEASPVQLLVADIAMPDVDGYELIERVRAMRGDCGRVPAVAVSAYARAEDRSRAAAAGYNGYCLKPLETTELLRVVDAVLSDGERGPNA